MTSNTFDFEYYQITLVKEYDYLTIQYLHKILFKVYKKKLAIIDIENICSGLDLENFYKICLTSFESLTFDDSKSIIKIFNMDNVIQVQINYINYLHFKFIFNIPLVETINMSSSDLIINNLQKKTNDLQKKTDDLQKKTDDSQNKINDLQNKIDDLESLINNMIQKL